MSRRSPQSRIKLKRRVLTTDVGTQQKRSEPVILLTPETRVGAAIDDSLQKETDRLRTFDLTGRIPMGTSKK